MIQKAKSLCDFLTKKGYEYFMRILKVVKLVGVCGLIALLYNPTTVATNEEIITIEASDIGIESSTEDVTEIEEESTEEESTIDPYQERLSAYYKRCEEVNQITDAEEWFDAYLEMAKEYSDIFTVPNLSDTLSDKDIEYFYRMVETETYQQSFSSKARVACVALNRLEDGRFGHTLYEVITRKPKQFAYGRTKIDESTKKACMYAYAVKNIALNALYFDSFDTIQTTYDYYLFTDEAGHNFYYH